MTMNMEEKAESDLLGAALENKARIAAFVAALIWLAIQHLEEQSALEAAHVEQILSPCLYGDTSGTLHTQRTSPKDPLSSPSPTPASLRREGNRCSHQDFVSRKHRKESLS